MTFNRLIPNICSDDLAASRDFFVALLDFAVGYDSDWYIQLYNPEYREFEFGIIKRDHDLVPPQYQTAPTGFYLTFVVPDVDAVYTKAQQMGLSIMQVPRNEFYGQRRLLVSAPSGCLVDICSPWSEAEK